MWLITLHVLINQMEAVEPKRYCQSSSAENPWGTNISLHFHKNEWRKKQGLFCSFAWKVSIRCSFYMFQHCRLYSVGSNEVCSDGISVYNSIGHNKCVELTGKRYNKRSWYTFDETNIVIQFTSVVTDYEFMLSVFCSSVVLLFEFIGWCQ